MEQASRALRVRYDSDPDPPKVKYDTGESCFQDLKLTKVFDDALSACQALEETIEKKVLAADARARIVQSKGFS